MKQSVKRVILTGDWEEIEFNHKARVYFVKNFTDDDIFVSFSNDEIEDEAFKIKSGIGEEVAITYNLNNSREVETDKIYVKGTGEVEIQQLNF